MIGPFHSRNSLKEHRYNQHDHEDDDETVVFHFDLVVQEFYQAKDDAEEKDLRHPSHAVTPEAVDLWFAFLINAWVIEKGHVMC